MLCKRQAVLAKDIVHQLHLLNWFYALKHQEMSSNELRPHKLTTHTLEITFFYCLLIVIFTMQSMQITTLSITNVTTQPTNINNSLDPKILAQNAQAQLLLFRFLILMFPIIFPFPDVGLFHQASQLSNLMNSIGVHINTS